MLLYLVRKLDSAIFKKDGDKLSRITNNIINLITSISLLVLVYSFFVLRGIQPEGHTINIYEQLPFRFYLALLFCFLTACVMLLAYRKMSAALILFLVHTTIMTIPYMLGYASAGRYELFSYMGPVAENGFSGFANLSPTGPLLTSTLGLVSGLKIGALSYFLPVFFSILFITGMFLFYRIFMSREKLVSVAFLSSIIPYFGHFQVSIYPYYLSFCLIPLYLFVLRNALSAKNKAMAVCLLFMLPLLPLAHPFIFVYLVCFSLLLAVSGTILKPGLLRGILGSGLLSRNPSNSVRKKVPVFIFLSFTSVSFLLYAKYTSEISGGLLSGLALRASLIMNSNFLRIPETGQGLFEFLHLFNLSYGKHYIPLIFILINSVIVWQNRKRFCHHFVRRYPRFLILYIATFFLEIAFLLNPFIPYPLEIFANLSFIIFAQIPLLGYSLYVIFLRKGYTLGLGAAVLVLCLLWTIGFFTCYSSPYTGGISEVVSENEVQGMQWFSGVKENYPYVMPLSEDGNILSGNVSNSPKSKKADMIYSGSGYNASEDRFESATVLETQSKNKPLYFIVTTLSETLNLNTQESNKGIQAYTVDSEGEHASVSKIYDSLNIDVYKNSF